MLLKLNTALRSAAEGADERAVEVSAGGSTAPTGAPQVFERYQYVLHFSCLCAALGPVDSPDAARLLLKLKVAMLRYLDLVQPDKLLYEAGMACRVSGRCRAQRAGRAPRATRTWPSPS